MKKPVFTILLLASVIIVNGQRIGFTEHFQQATLLLKVQDKKLIDTGRFNNLLQLADYKMSKEDYSGQDLDSAFTLIQQAAALNSKHPDWKSDGIVLLYHSKFWRKKEKTDSARLLARQAIQYFYSLKDTFQLIPAFLQLSRCYNSNMPGRDAWVKTTFDTAFQLNKRLLTHGNAETISDELRSFYDLEIASDSYPIQLYFLNGLIEVCRLTNKKINEFWARKQFADVRYKNGELRNAITDLLQIAEEQKAGGFPNICFTYDLLSAFYHADGNFDRSLYYALKAVNRVKTAHDSAYVTFFYSRIAENHRITGNEEEALNWSLKRLDYLVSQKQTFGQITAIYESTNSLIKLGRPKEALALLLEKSKGLVPADYFDRKEQLASYARCYAAVKNYKLAEYYCDELIKEQEWRVHHKKLAYDLGVDQILSWIYLQMGQLDKAEKHYNRAVATITPLWGYADAIYEKSFLYKLDSAKGNFNAAMADLQDYQKVRDSLFSVTKTKQIEELKIAYATEQKDSLINLKEQNLKLFAKQDVLQKSQLKQGAILRNISFAVLALLIIIMALLYNRYRRKQKTNRLLQSQQEIINKSNYELRQLNEQQKKLLAEKDWLVKEIHHRVKNNLQMVVSLLNAQTEFLTHPSAIDAIKESRERMQAIAIIHQKLYQVDNTTEVNMRSYINELVENIKNSFADSEQIYFKLDVDDVGLDISQSVPLGLILNEAITNAVKYAYPENEKGSIQVSLKRHDTHKLQLKIADNGKGLPPGINIEQSNSLGVQLIKLFSEQLEGELYFINNNGLEIILNFKTAEYKNLTLVKATA